MPKYPGRTIVRFGVLLYDTAQIHASLHGSVRRFRSLHRLSEHIKGCV